MKEWRLTRSVSDLLARWGIFVEVSIAAAPPSDIKQAIGFVVGLRPGTFVLKRVTETGPPVLHGSVVAGFSDGLYGLHEAFSVQDASDDPGNLAPVAGECVAGRHQWLACERCPAYYPQIIASLTQLKLAVAALGVINNHDDMSNASFILKRAALKNCGLRMTTVRVTDLVGFEPNATPAFAGWGARSEEEAMPDLYSHFAKHFCLPAGTHVEDVHGGGAFLTWDVRCVDTHARDVVTHLSGKTDFMVTNTEHVDDVDSAAEGAVCLVEIKTAKALKAKRAACCAQAVLELLSIEKLCGYAVPVVMTNLMEHGDDGSGIHVFSRKGRIIRDFIGAEGKPLTLAEANGVLAVLLPAVLAERARVYAKLLAEEIKDGNDGDDDARGAEEEEEEEGETMEGGGVHASDASVGAAALMQRRSQRSHGGAASSSCALSTHEALLYDALEKEEHARHLQSLVDSSPLIQLVLRHASAAANT